MKSVAYDLLYTHRLTKHDERDLTKNRGVM